MVVDLPSSAPRTLEADNFAIDDHTLYVLADGEQVAVFAPGAWLGAEKIATPE